VHRRLIERFGRPEWSVAYAPLDELIGTILSQHTSDVNSSRAFARLHAAFADWEAVRDAPLPELVATIRSGGLAVVKAQRIQSVLRALTDDDDGRVRLPDLRRLPRQDALALLTSLPGVGRKTASCVLLFGAQIPAIPVDTHVHRVALRLGLAPPRASPTATADLLEAAIPPEEYYAFHVNLIRLGREVCKAPRPRCEVCPLCARCQTGRAVRPSLEATRRVGEQRWPAAERHARSVAT
jgi:endonuclease-3